MSHRFSRAQASVLATGAASLAFAAGIATASAAAPAPTFRAGTTRGWSTIDVTGRRFADPAGEFATAASPTGEATFLWHPTSARKAVGGAVPPEPFWLGLQVDAKGRTRVLPNLAVDAVDAISAQARGGLVVLGRGRGTGGRTYGLRRTASRWTAGRPARVPVDAFDALHADATGFSVLSLGPTQRVRRIDGSGAVAQVAARLRGEHVARNGFDSGSDFESGVGWGPTGSALFATSELIPGAGDAAASSATSLVELGATPRLTPLTGATDIGAVQVATDGAYVAVAGLDIRRRSDDYASEGKPLFAVAAPGQPLAMQPIPLPLPKNRQALRVRIAQLPSGGAIVTWIEKAKPNFSIETGVPHWAYVTATGGLVRQGRLSSSAEVLGLEVASVRGRVLASWVEGKAGDRTNRVRLALLDGDAPEPVPSVPGRPIDGYIGYESEVGVAVGGNAVAVAFSDRTTGRMRLARRTLPAR